MNICSFLTLLVCFSPLLICCDFDSESKKAEQEIAYKKNPCPFEVGDLIKEKTSGVLWVVSHVRGGCMIIKRDYISSNSSSGTAVLGASTNVSIDIGDKPKQGRIESQYDNPSDYSSYELVQKSK